MDLHLPREHDFLNFLVSGLRLSAASQRRASKKMPFPAFELSTSAVSMQFRQGYEHIVSNGVPEWLFRWSKGGKQTVVTSTFGAPSLTECDTLSPEIWQQPLVFSDLGLKHCFLHYNIVALQSIPDVRQLRRWMHDLHCDEADTAAGPVNPRAMWSGAFNGDLLINFVLQQADGLHSWQQGSRQKTSGYKLQSASHFLLQHGLLNPLVQFENPSIWYPNSCSNLPLEHPPLCSVNPWSHLFEPELVFLLPFLANQAGWNQWLQSLLRGPANNPILEHILLLIDAAESVNRMDVLRPLIASICDLFTSASVIAFITELDQQLTSNYDTIAQIEQHRKIRSITLGKLLEPCAAITELEALPTFERRPDQQQLLYWCTELELYTALSRAHSLQESLLGSVGTRGVFATAGLSFT